MPKYNDKKIDTSATNQPTEANTSKNPKNNGRLLLIITSVLLFIAASIAGIDIFVRYNMHGQDFISRPTSFYGERLGGHMRMGWQQTTYIRNNSATSTDSTIIGGVVTSINDNGFVVGGSGETITIKTNEQTTYNTTSKKVSVADSVIVIGNKSDGIITATSVRIVNN